MRAAPLPHQGAVEGEASAAASELSESESVQEALLRAKVVASLARRQPVHAPASLPISRPQTPSGSGSGSASTAAGTSSNRPLVAGIGTKPTYLAPPSPKAETARPSGSDRRQVLAALARTAADAAATRVSGSSSGGQSQQQ